MIDALGSIQHWCTIVTLPTIPAHAITIFLGPVCTLLVMNARPSIFVLPLITISSNLLLAIIVWGQISTSPLINKRPRFGILTGTDAVLDAKPNPSSPKTACGLIRQRTPIWVPAKITPWLRITVSSRLTVLSLTSVKSGIDMWAHLVTLFPITVVDTIRGVVGGTKNWAAACANASRELSNII